MLFNSIEFLIFFPLVLAIYAALRPTVMGQNICLVLASYFFYGWWDPRFLVLIAVSTTTDYVCGMIAGRRTVGVLHLARAGALLASLLGVLALLGVADIGLITALVVGYTAVMSGAVALTAGLARTRRARMFLGLSVTLNLGLLGVFKYFDFFAESFAQMAAGVDWEPGFVTLDLILPVGISFYTFQTMSYAIDIYRGRLQPTDRLVDFAAFVSFFPQLVAGPIERAKDLLPQFAAPRRLEAGRIKSGAMLFLWGLTKKVVIADNLAPIADAVFADPAAAAPGAMTVAVLAFAFQIYCDFSGYSDMARGTARIMGIDLTLNFNLPYFARTPSEFWLRWHISLSSWLRDYVYIPLGGNRGGVVVTYSNLMVTMLLGGLWHGAAWTFVCWGALHGAILIAYRLARIDDWLAVAKTGGHLGALRDAALMAGLFVLVCVGWVFFRATSLADAMVILRGTNLNLTNSPDATVFFAYVLPLVAIQVVQLRTRMLEFWRPLPGFMRYNLVLFLVFAIIFLGAEGGQQFIYFNF